MRTYYQVLGVSEQASASVIKAAFKRLAVRYHPDKNPDSPTSEELFKEVNEAYQVLSDPDRKFLYDQRIYAIKHAGVSPRTADARQRAAHRRQSYMSRSRSMRSQWRESRDHYRPHGATGYSSGTRNPIKNTFRGKNDYSKGIIASLSLAGVIALVVSLCLSVYTMVDRLEKRAVQREQEQFIANLRNNHDADSLRRTLAIIDRRIEREEEFNTMLFDFRNSVIRIMKEDATKMYQRENYEGALKFLKIWKEQFPKDQDILDPQIVNCQMAIGLIQQAEKLLQTIQKRNKSHLFVYMKLGEIYYKHQQKPQDALFYYNKASQYIIQQYKEQYGNAYAIMMDPTKTPPAQYEVFMAKAKLAMQLGQYQAAKNASVWASMLRPHKIDPWICQADAYRKLGQPDQACQSWRKGMEGFGHVLLLDSLTRYCKPQ